MASFTEDDVNNLFTSLGLNRQQEQTPEVSALSRAGMAVANLPSNIANTLTNTAQQIALSPQDRNLNLVPKVFNPPPPVTFAQKAADVIGEQFLPQAAAFAVPYTGLAKAGEALGLVGPALEMFSQGGAGALMSPDHPIQGALTGAGLGSVSGLSRAARLLPLAGMAGASTLYGVSQGENPTESAVQNAVQFGFGLLPGIHENAASPNITQDQSGHYVPTELDTHPMYDEPPRSQYQLGGEGPIQNQNYGMHPTIEADTSRMQLLPSGHVPSYEEPQIQNYPDTSHLRLLHDFTPEDASETGLQNATTSTRGMFLQSIDADRINRALDIGRKDLALQDLNDQLAILQDAHSQTTTHPSEQPAVEPPTVEDLGLHQTGTRRAFAAAKTIEEQSPILPEETNIVNKVKTENTPEVIQGPALMDSTGKAFAKGEVGQKHADLQTEAMGNAFEAGSDEYASLKHGFHTSEDRTLNRIEGADLVLKNGQITPEEHAAMMARKEPGLESQDLPNLRPPKSFQPEEAKPQAKSEEINKQIEDLQKRIENIPTTKTNSNAYRNRKISKEILQEKIDNLKSESKNEKIVAAATRTKDGSIFTGSWHGESAEKAIKAGKLKVNEPRDDGFVTNKGRFLTRDEVSDILSKKEGANIRADFRNTKNLKIPKSESAILQKKTEPFVTKNSPLGEQIKAARKKLVIQSKTPEFKKWFGDSKVVDEKGKPIVVYHGTQRAGFDTFEDYSHFGTAEQANAIIEQRAKSREKFIKNYGKQGENLNESTLAYGHNDAIYPVYLKIENPKLVKDVGSGWGTEINKAIGEGYDGLKYFNTEEGAGYSYIPFSANQIKSAIGNTGKFSLKTGNISGQVSAPTLFALGRASVGAVTGGTIAYQKTDGDWRAALGGALLGAGAFALADPRAVKALMTVPMHQLELEGKPPVKALAQSEQAGLKKLAATPLIDLAGQAIDNRGTNMSKVARAFEVLSGRLIPQSWITSNQIAQGAVEQIAKTVNDAWKEMKNYSPNADVVERVGKYFQGQLTDKAEVQKLVSSEGGMDHNSWLESKATDRVGLDSIWRIGEPIGDKTIDNANILHISQATRDKLVNMENMLLTKDLTGTDLAFAKAAQAPRLAMNAYQQMLIKALPEDTQLHSIISNSTQQYVTRRYGIFNGFKPTDEQVSAAAKQYGLKEGSAILQEAQAHGNAYTSNAFHAAIQDAPNDPNWAHFVEIEHAHQIAPGSDAVDLQKWHVTPDTLEKYKVATDDDYTNLFIKQYLRNTQEGKQLYGMNAESGGLDTTLLKEREMLSPTFRELLGEYKDPVEKMGHALNAIIPMAKGAQRINALVGQTELNGLANHYADKGEWVKTKDTLKAQIESATAVGNTVAAKALQSKLNYLLTYSDTGANIKFGIAKGGMISRALSDQLLGLQGGWGDFESALSRGWVQTVNRYNKETHSVWNPAIHMRNILQAPMFMATARVAPSRAIEAFADIGKYFKSGQASDNLAEAIAHGVLHGTYASGELGANFSNIANGTHDVSAFGKFRSRLFEFYNMSDAATRVAAYLSAKDRYSAMLGKGLDDSEVINKAIQFTNERTLDFANVVPAVRLMSKIPLFNLYASYSFEVAKIGKNLLRDTVSGEDLSTRLHAAATLASIAAIPEVLQRMSVANLSNQDQKDWEQLQKVAPDYSRSRYKFVTGRDANGNFHYVDYTSIVPQNDWSQTARSLAANDWKGVAQVNPIAGWDKSPFLNIVSEQITGKDFNNDRDFRGFQDRVFSAAQALTPSYTPGIGYDWEKWMNTGITNLRTGKSNSFEDNLTRLFTGVSPSTVNPNTLNMSAAYDLKDKIQLEKQYLMDVMRTDIGQDRKDHAMKVFQTAIATLIENYRNKIMK